MRTEKDEKDGPQANADKRVTFGNFLQQQKTEVNSTRERQARARKIE